MKVTMGILKAMRSPMVERPLPTTGILSLKRTIRATIPPRVLRIDKDSYLVSYEDNYNDGYVKVFDIENAGTQNKILSTKMTLITLRFCRT